MRLQSLCPSTFLSQNKLVLTKQSIHLNRSGTDSSTTLMSKYMKVLWPISSKSIRELPNKTALSKTKSNTYEGMETIHVTLDELHQTMDPVHATNFVLPTDKDLELLFQPMFDEYFEVTRVNAPVPSATAVNAQVVPPGTSVSTTFAQDAPSTSFSLSSSGIQPLVIQHNVAVGATIEDTPITQATLYPLNNPVTREPGSAQSSSGDILLVPVSNQKTITSDALRCCVPYRTVKSRTKEFQNGRDRRLLFQAMQDDIITSFEIDWKYGIVPSSRYCNGYPLSSGSTEFWNTIKYDEKTRVYCYQVDEQWFNLSADLLRKALDITPVDPTHPFELPPTGDTVIDFVNQLGKVRKGKPSLVDEEDEAHKKPEPQGEGDDPTLELVKKLSLDAHQEKGEVGGVAIRERVAKEIQRLPDVEGKGKAIFILQRRDQAPHDSTTGPSSQPQDDTSEKVVHESSSTTDSERTESETEATAPKVDKEQGEVASTTVTSGVGISVHTENQAGSDPGQGHEALAGSNLEPMQEDSGPREEHVALAGPNPEHMDEDFYATAYPKVHENLKLRTDEHVILENPESSSATLSSMKNLDETDNFGDQFLNDKPTEDDQEKTNVVDETDSIIPDPSHQTNTSAPPVTTPVINISSPKPSSQVNAPPINTKATSNHHSYP
ncbi:hypothetical protein Tco_1538620 [Tanacetum coccineum]